MGGTTPKILLGFILFVVTFFRAEETQAKVFFVTGNGDVATCATICTLRGAIAAADTNAEVDTIYIDPTIKQIALTSELAITANDSLDDGVDVTIIGNTVINAQKNSRVFSIGKNTHVTMQALHITGGHLDASSSLQGAGIHNQGILELVGVKIYNNTINSENTTQQSALRGAGIYNASGASLFITKSEIGPRNILDVVGKKSRAEGAGIYNANKLSIIDSNIYNNYAMARSTGDKGSANAHGGGLFSTASVPVYMYGSSVYANKTEASIQKKAPQAESQGAGLYIDSSSTFSITNSTISGNSATAYNYTGPGGFAFGNGGAIYAGAYSKTYLANVTVAENSVKVPTAKYLDGTATGHAFFVVISAKTSFKIKNSIVTSQGKNCIYKIKSDGYNVVSDNSCFASGVGDQINTNPWLLAFGFNGGFTKTHGLSPISTAIDGGAKDGCFDYANKLLLVDQRGYDRPSKNCDSGAFELP